MSLQAITWALHQSTGGPGTKVLLIALANYANEDNVSYPSVERLAQETDQSESSVKRGIARLIEMGLVTRSHRGGEGEGRQTNLYTLHVARGLSDPEPLQVKSGGATGQIEGGYGSLLTPKPKNQRTKEDPPVRIDVQRLCNHLATNVRANGAKAEVTASWRNEARRLLDLDKRPEAEAHELIDWTTSHHFWRANVLAMPTFRRQYDKLRLQRAGDLAASGGGSNPRDVEYAFTERPAPEAPEVWA